MGKKERNKHGTDRHGSLDTGAKVSTIGDGLGLAASHGERTGILSGGRDAERVNTLEARQDVFDYIEMFYNPRRKHVRNGMLSPVEFERQQEM